MKKEKLQEYVHRKYVKNVRKAMDEELDNEGFFRCRMKK